MSDSAVCPRPLDECDVWLLDPDLERLFAEVDAILCEAGARLRGRAHPFIPAPRPRRASSPCRGRDTLETHGRHPEAWPATERGPPHKPPTTRCRAKEVMPASH
ncbi:hypothetical protein [Nocardia sp. R7R-8]|uniref:hypothetical protein n=1 Tax=Nocardia sp. R7R-8 TaxID=3459304 RepID=UPI00403E0822